MKNLITCIVLLAALPSAQPHRENFFQPVTEATSENLIIVTIDGFRWQEIFSGVDSLLLNDEEYTPDAATMRMLYWADDPEERRKKLLPFFWSIIASKGQLYGNRELDNKVNTANLFRVSYPGYNEIFTGHTDISVSSNKRKNNKNRNVLEYLNDKEEFNGKVAAFTSWDVFPYILNEERNGMLINSGYEDMEGDLSSGQEMINAVQNKAVNAKGGTRYDQLTLLSAREYIQKEQPRVVLIGLGETDEYAHQGRYDLYIEQAHQIDAMLAELWHWIQTTPGYRNNTSLLITTDHGRGSRQRKWTSHSAFIRGSSETWLAMMGPGIEAKGEIKQDQQLYQKQLASLIANLVGEEFGKNDTDEIISAR